MTYFIAKMLIYFDFFVANFVIFNNQQRSGVGDMLFVMRKHKNPYLIICDMHSLQNEKRKEEISILKMQSSDRINLRTKSTPNIC